jgi:hypothetical protein
MWGQDQNHWLRKRAVALGKVKSKGIVFTGKYRAYLLFF